MTRARISRAMRAVGVAATLAACRGGDARPADSTAAPPVATLTGAGATFPYPVYARWFGRYATGTGTYINYQSIGSGGGMAQLAAGTVDFGASDSPVASAELERAPGGPVLYVPMVVGAVAIAYNLDSLASPVRMDGATLADIFRGRITRWNDPRLARLNTGLRLPARDIVVVHRADGSGTTRAFTTYLAAASDAWRRGVGAGETVRFPTGLGARGNEGVAGQVKQSPGAIGYVELTYARQNRLPVASLRNPAGAFVQPSVQAMSAAAEAVLDSVPPGGDLRVSLVNAPAPDAYPLASFSWILVREQPADPARAVQLRRFLEWALAEGDDDARALDYAPLPERLRPAARATIARIGSTR